MRNTVEGKCRWQMRLASRFPFEARAASVCVSDCESACVCVLMLCFDKPASCAALRIGNEAGVSMAAVNDVDRLCH